jgi:hypothetical protein
LHALAEIAGALRDNRDAMRPEALAMSGAIRRDRDAQMPSPIAAKPAQQSRQHQPFKTQRSDIADVPGETALTAAKRRRAYE